MRDTHLYVGTEEKSKAWANFRAPLPPAHTPDLASYHRENHRIGRLRGRGGGDREWDRKGSLTKIYHVL